MRNQIISSQDRRAYINLFREARDLAVESPFHYLIFDEGLSPVLKALTLDEILRIHPTDAPYSIRVWSCADVGDIAKTKQIVWEENNAHSGISYRAGTVMLVVPPLDSQGQREAGTWETVYRRRDCNNC